MKLFRYFAITATVGLAPGGLCRHGTSRRLGPEIGLQELRPRWLLRPRLCSTASATSRSRSCRSFRRRRGTNTGPTNAHFLTPAAVAGPFYGPPLTGNFPVNPYFPGPAAPVGYGPAARRPGASSARADARTVIPRW